jgi:endogenous inhibitor of DNA gyrase (YacG/DUF329 family)
MSVADASPCPRCGQPVSATTATGEPGEQLAEPVTHCPSCGAALVRDVDGPADHGWRVVEPDARE